jgi:hypothetical protein
MVLMPVANHINERSGRKGYGENIVAKTRKSETAVEIHEFYVIRTASGSLPGLCAECSTGDAVMAAPEQAAALAHVPVRAIYRWVEAGAVHYKEGHDGSLTVCLKSLPPAGNQAGEV